MSGGAPIKTSKANSRESFEKINSTHRTTEQATERGPVNMKSKYN